MNSYKKKKISLARLFTNNKFLLILSLLISFSIWLTLSSSTNSDTTSIISDIPVNIELSAEAQKDGLQIFKGNETTASVSVTGNKVTVGSLSKSDIQVVAQQTSTITSPGTYTLPLVAKQAGVKTGYQIVSEVSPSFVTVTVDRFRSVEMNIVDNLTYHVNEGYYGTTVLSDEKVTITGAEKEVERIVRVEINGKIDGVLTKSQTVETKIKLYDKDDKEITDSTVNLSVSDITATISVLPKKTVPLNLTFTNKPTGLSIDSSWIKIEPSEILVAGNEETIANLNKIDLGPIDFTTLQNQQNTQKLDIVLPSDCKNLSNESTVSVTLDLSKLSKKTLEVTKFVSSGLDSSYAFSTSTKSMSVTIFGPSDQISKISANDVTAVIDFAKRTDVVVGSTEYPLTITFSNSYSGCWAYGPYKANITITKK